MKNKSVYNTIILIVFFFTSTGNILYNDAQVTKFSIFDFVSVWNKKTNLSIENEITKHNLYSCFNIYKEKMDSLSIYRSNRYTNLVKFNYDSTIFFDFKNCNYLIFETINTDNIYPKLEFVIIKQSNDSVCTTYYTGYRNSYNLNVFKRIGTNYFKNRLNEIDSIVYYHEPDELMTCGLNTMITIILKNEIEVFPVFGENMNILDSFEKDKIYESKQ